MRRFVLAFFLVAGTFVYLAITDTQAAGQKGGVRPVLKTIEIDIPTADDVKVRTMKLPGEFDEKGNVKKPSFAEANKLKGDTPEERRLRGYKIELSGLHTGDVVTVSIGKPREAPKSSKTDDKPAKVTYTHITDLQGTVSKVSGSHVSIKITSTSVQQGRVYNQNNNNKGTQTLDEKLVATMIVVEQPAAEKKGK